MLCASVSCWAHLFLQHLRRRSLWIIGESDDRRIHASREISLTVWWLWGLSSWLSNSDSTVSTLSSKRTASAAARTPVDCSELHQQPVDAVLRPTFVQKLCYKLPSVVTFRFIHTFDQSFCLLYWMALKLAHLLDTASKFALFLCPVWKMKSS